MLDFERELMNRFLTAAAMAKADGFENTAAAMLAVAKDMYDDIAARSLGGNDTTFKTIQTKYQATISMAITLTSC